MLLNELFIKANALDYTHSNGMYPISTMKGPGFFPGCIGTIKKNIPLENLAIMLVGQDFDTEANHQKIDAEKGEVEKNTTWRNLKRLLDEINIDPEQCFFTNAYMGLRPNSGKETKKNTGTSPAAQKGAEAFAKECYEFFKTQLRTIQPKLVLVLGKETAKFMAKAFPTSFFHWENIDTLKKLYEKEEAVFADLEFEGKPIRFVFAIHPSLNGTNRSIIWGKEEGKNKEIALLKKYTASYI